MPSGDAYRAALSAAKLNQSQAAKLFATTVRTSNRWAAEGAPPVVMAMLVLIARGTVTSEEVEKIIAAEAGNV